MMNKSINAFGKAIPYLALLVELWKTDTGKCFLFVASLYRFLNTRGIDSSNKVILSSTKVGEAILFIKWFFSRLTGCDFKTGWCVDKVPKYKKAAAQTENVNKLPK